MFFLLQREENNIFGNIHGKDYMTLRKLIIELILATDARISISSRTSKTF